MTSIPKPEESAVAKLDKLLDERGIEHDYPGKKEFYGGGYIEWQNDGGIKFRASNACFSVSPDEFARKLIVHMVKVTPEQAIAFTLGQGTLTAEDVRSFLNRNSLFDDTTWPHGRQELVFDEDDLQAMADELNATLGRGTCKHTRTFNLVKRECDGERYEWHDDELPRRCPNCGAEVTR